MSNTYSHPLTWQVRNPNYYTQVAWDSLRVNHWYAFEMEYNRFCGVKILTNNNDVIRYECYGTVYTINKNSATERQTNGFYQKNHYHPRENYLKLSEGLNINPEVRQPPNVKYLLDPEVQKEIASNLGGKRRKNKTKLKKSKKIKRKNKTKSKKQKK